MVDTLDNLINRFNAEALNESKRSQINTSDLMFRYEDLMERDQMTIILRYLFIKDNVTPARFRELFDTYGNELIQKGELFDKSEIDTMRNNFHNAIRASKVRSQVDKSVTWDTLMKWLTVAGYIFVDIRITLNNPTDNVHRVISLAKMKEHFDEDHHVVKDAIFSYKDATNPRLSTLSKLLRYLFTKDGIDKDKYRTIWDRYGATRGWLAKLGSSRTNYASLIKKRNLTWKSFTKWLTVAGYDIENIELLLQRNGKDETVSISNILNEISQQIIS